MEHLLISELFPTAVLSFPIALTLTNAEGAELPIFVAAQGSRIVLFELSSDYQLIDTISYSIGDEIVAQDAYIVGSTVVVVTITAAYTLKFTRFSPPYSSPPTPLLSLDLLRTARPAPCGGPLLSLRADLGVCAACLYAGHVDVLHFRPGAESTARHSALSDGGLTPFGLAVCDLGIGQNTETFVTLLAAEPALGSPVLELLPTKTQGTSFRVPCGRQIVAPASAPRRPLLLLGTQSAFPVVSVDSIAASLEVPTPPALPVACTGVAGVAAGEGLGGEMLVSYDNGAYALISDGKAKMLFTSHAGAAATYKCSDGSYIVLQCSPTQGAVLFTTRPSPDPAPAPAAPAAPALAAGRDHDSLLTPAPAPPIVLTAHALPGDTPAPAPRATAALAATPAAGPVWDLVGSEGRLLGCFGSTVRVVGAGLASTNRLPGPRADVVGGQDAGNGVTVGLLRSGRQFVHAGGQVRALGAGAQWVGAPWAGQVLGLERGGCRDEEGNTYFNYNDNSEVVAVASGFSGICAILASGSVLLAAYNDQSWSVKLLEGAGQGVFEVAIINEFAILTCLTRLTILDLLSSLPSPAPAPGQHLVFAGAAVPTSSGFAVPAGRPGARVLLHFPLPSPSSAPAPALVTPLPSGRVSTSSGLETGVSAVLVTSLNEESRSETSSGLILAQNRVYGVNGIRMLGATDAAGYTLCADKTLYSAQLSTSRATFISGRRFSGRTVAVQPLPQQRTLVLSVGEVPRPALPVHDSWLGQVTTEKAEMPLTTISLVDNSTNGVLARVTLSKYQLTHTAWPQPQPQGQGQGQGAGAWTLVLLGGAESIGVPGGGVVAGKGVLVLIEIDADSIILHNIMELTRPPTALAPYTHTPKPAVVVGAGELLMAEIHIQHDGRPIITTPASLPLGAVPCLATRGGLVAVATVAGLTVLNYENGNFNLVASGAGVVGAAGCIRHAVFVDASLLFVADNFGGVSALRVGPDSVSVIGQASLGAQVTAAARFEEDGNAFAVFGTVSGQIWAIRVGPEGVPAPRFWTMHLESKSAPSIGNNGSMAYWDENVYV